MKIMYLLSKLIKKTNISAIKKTDIDKTSKICSGSYIVNSELKRYSYVGNFSTIINTEIGSFCSIADNCIIGGAGHPVDWVSTSPVFHKGKNVLKKNFSNNTYKPYKATYIGNDVWIGSNCLIKAGVKISNGAIIGMGSVVTKDVGSYEIWGGNPARCIKKRFDVETINQLENSQWWLWDDESIEKRADLFNQPIKFLEGE